MGLKRGKTVSLSSNMSAQEWGDKLSQLTAAASASVQEILNKPRPSNVILQVRVVGSLLFYSMQREGRTIEGVKVTFIGEPVQDTNRKGFVFSEFGLRPEKAREVYDRLGARGVPFLVLAEFRLPLNREGSLSLQSLLPIEDAIGALASEGVLGSAAARAASPPVEGSDPGDVV